MTIDNTLLSLLILIVTWDIVWKGIGLWKSAKHNQLSWFLAILIINTAGILPIIYIIFFQADKKKK